MSEIREYRGKRLDNGEFKFGMPIKSNTGKTYIITYLDDANGTPERVLWVEVDPSTVGQYTGRFAADNFTKLFEGDIVAHSYIGSKAIIRFGEYCDDADGQEKTHIGYYLEYLDKDCTYYKGLNKWASYPSIVYRLGNIYDNPELLEVEE